MIAAEQVLAAELPVCPLMVSPDNITRPGEHRFDMKPIFDKTLRDDDALNVIIIEDDEGFSTPKPASSDAEYADAIDGMSLASKRSASTSPASESKKRKSTEKTKRAKKPRKDDVLDDDEDLERKIEKIFLDIYATPESPLRSFLLRNFRFSPASQARLFEANVPVDAFNNDLRNEESLTHVVIGKDESERISCLERDCRRMLTTISKWEREYCHFTAEASFASTAVGMIRSKALELQSICHVDTNGLSKPVYEHARSTLKDMCRKAGLRRYKNKFYAWSVKPKQ